jgi:hypothetical protein
VYFGGTHSTRDQVFSLRQRSEMEKCLDFTSLPKGVVKLKPGSGIRSFKLLQTLKDPNESPISVDLKMPVKKKKKKNCFFFRNIKFPKKKKKEILRSVCENNGQRRIETDKQLQAMENFK